MIADDHRLFADSLAVTLGRDFEVAGVASDGDAVLTLLQRCPTDCLLLDVMMPGKNGLELIPRGRDLQPSTKILVVTMLLERALANVLLDAGAYGFVPKDAGLDEFTFALREVLAGRRYVSPRLPKTGSRVGMHAHHLALQRLTPRQEQGFLLFGEGQSESDIARSLGLSACTITYHKDNLMRALGIESEAVLRSFSVLVRTEVNAARLREPGRGGDGAV